MTTIRVARRPRFTQIDRRTVNDAALSYRARGVLAWLLDKPDDWTTTAERIASQGKEGRDAIRAALHELEELRYLSRRKWRSAETGQWCSEWLVFERPVDGDPERIPSAGDPPQETSAGKPAPETQAPISTTETETETDLGHERFASENEGQEPDPDCPQCQGSGSIVGLGTGRDTRGNEIQSAVDRPCDCLTRERDTSAPGVPPWLAHGMTACEWMAAGSPPPPPKLAGVR